MYPKFFSTIVGNFELTELSLYDCKISPQALVDLSDVLAMNKRIRKLDLSYNPEAFENKEAIS
jgi:hypothetical protein